MHELDGARVAVIGGAGFLGSHIVDGLVAGPADEITVLDNFVRGTRANLETASRDPRVRIVEGSIEDRVCLASVLDGVDYVFLLAALWLYECVHEPRRAIEVNVVGTYNVVEAAQTAGVKRVVYSSSASVYGDALVIPMTEEHPFNNRSMYGATKIAGEQFMRAANHQNGFPYVALRYMNIYGPRMDDRGAYVSVIMKVLDRLDAGQPPIIFGDGTQAYDFVHVSDVARANLLAMAADTTDAAYNIGMGVKTTIGELVDRLLAITGSALRPEYRDDPNTFVKHRIGSTDKAERDLGFRATVDLDAGLRSVVEWHRARRGLAAAAR
jgi:UDP-glucose 4-epimerase